MPLERTSAITNKQVSKLMEHLNVSELNRDVKRVKLTDIPPLDDANKKAGEILLTQGNAAFIKHVFNPTGEKELSYAEMRARYG